MKHARRSFLRLATGAAALPAVVRQAQAQTYPARPVLLLVGFAAGGPTDICARLISDWLSKRLGRQFIVENRSGAASNIATEAAARAEPDGYTLLLVTSSNAINATLYNDLNFNFMRDMVAVAGIMQAPSVLEVNLSVPVKTVPEFIAYAKANPGKINMGTAGNGSPPHMFGELFKTMAGVNFTEVGYRGGGLTLVDLLAGQVQGTFGSIPATIEYIRAGRLRPLAVTSAKRSAALPDIPAIAEFVPGYDGVGWIGLGAPKGTPRPIIDMLSDEVSAALADPIMKARFADLGAVPMPMASPAFGKFIGDETEKWAKVIRAGGIQ
jgi:tripartite-type tricarboxylate transporter receptor subunit TctC